MNKGNEFQHIYLLSTATGHQKMLEHPLRWPREQCWVSLLYSCLFLPDSQTDYLLEPVTRMSMRGKSRLQTWCYACSTVSASSASASAIGNARSEKQIEAALDLQVSSFFLTRSTGSRQSIVSRTTWHVNHWITLNRCIIWKLQNGRTTIHTRANCSRQPDIKRERTHVLVPWLQSQSSHVYRYKSK